MRWTLIVFVLLSLGSQVCCGQPAAQAQQDMPHIAGQELSASVLQKLSAPISRETMLNALLGNSNTKSALLQEARKLGYSEQDVSLAGRVPLTVKKLTRASVTDPNEEAYQALDWRTGFKFSLKSMPKYGPSNYLLGSLWVHPVEYWPGWGDQDYMRLRFNSEAWICSPSIRVHLDLPMRPALYAYAIKLVRLDGKCCPGWLTPKTPSGNPAIYCRVLVGDGSTTGRLLPVTLTTLPDQTGFAGFLSVNPTAPLVERGPGQMRRCTACVDISVLPSLVRAGEDFTLLCFASITIRQI